jgi:hypothetical protein
MRELCLWVYTGQVLGHRRVLLVADSTVGGAKDRFGMSFGNPSLKNAIPSSSPGFPAWIQEPGTWVSIAPLESGHASTSEFSGLDRYSQDISPKPPQWLPNQEEAFLHGDKIHAVIGELGAMVAQLLQERFPHKVLKSA